MTIRETELRTLLTQPPYTTLPSWSDNLRMLGSDYLDQLPAEQLQALKAKLDRQLRGETQPKTRSFYDDDPLLSGRVNQPNSGHRFQRR